MTRIVGLGLLSLVTASTGSAQSAGPDIEARRFVEEGQRLYRELDFIAAVDSLERSLAVAGASDAVRLEALEYLGSAFVVLEREDDAREAFRRMFAIDPYRLVREPSGSPKISRFVEEVRASLVSDAALDPAVRVVPRLPRAIRAGTVRDIEVAVESSAPDRVLSVVAFVRTEDETTWQRVAGPSTSGTRFIELPAFDRPGEVELYLVARDPAGAVVSRAGSPQTPLLLSVRAGSPSEPSTSVLETWWFWTLVGVIAVGTGVGLGVALSGGESEPGTLPPGRVELPLR
ncbi:MAG: hypothetical protein AAGF12_30000 [Myxococcota bacterium]